MRLRARTQTTENRGSRELAIMVCEVHFTTQVARELCSAANRCKASLFYLCAGASRLSLPRKKKIGVTAKENKGASSIVRPEYRYRTHSRGQELEQTGVNVCARNKKKKCYFPFMCCILGSKLRKFCIGHFDPSLFQFFTPTASGCNSVLGLGGR